MNISAWTIYWFIKLDAIIAMMGGLSFISVVACVIAIAVILILCLNKETVSSSYRNEDAVNAEKEKWSRYIKYWTRLFKQLTVLSIVLSVMYHMIPTTKEMATIYVIPKIANSTFVNETLPAEMKDIYGMAKQWMKETLSPKETLKTPDVKAEPVKTEAEPSKTEQKK